MTKNKGLGKRPKGPTSSYSIANNKQNKSIKAKNKSGRKR